MNTTATFSSDHSWSRRCSTETVFSIQGKETDYARDTSDTEAAPADSDVEYEPATDSEGDDPPIDTDDTSAQSDNEIISTKVIEVCVGDDGELQLADSERTDSYESDSEMDLFDYWHCAQCRAENNNPLYRYCQKCFQVRKNFFPPRPKRKRNRDTKIDEIPRTLSQDSGVDSPMSQETPDLQETPDSQANPGEGTSKPDTTVSRCKKRRAEFAEREAKRKRARTDSDSDLSSDDAKVQTVRPLVKTISDPAITIDDDVKLTKKVIANSLIEKIESKDLCVICISEPKSGVFVHGRIAHICCCYKCAVKVWVKAKRCPVCNCKVSNVLKAVVM
ncbi:E3 ubiquitin-protein ligase Mdm2-like isoform X2 [Anticarsia gemmatalis]|uniref:E3 ubiquitin-protein ligase Mdm2-like isoform X2 n=1 Tax=Anticarsia gemmatalis TaxID=129554 RepID=UPI003F773BC9